MADCRLEVRIDGYRHPRHDRRFLSAVHFDVSAGQIAVVLGPSSIGKTTLLNAVLGVADGVTEGDVRFLSDAITLPATRACVRGLIGFCPAGAPMVPWLNMRNNLRLPSQLNPALKVPQQKQLLQLMESLALSERHLELFPDQVSEGTRSRFAIARILAYRQPFLFIDEAFGGLDGPTAEVIGAELRAHVSNHGAVCLLTTHDVATSLEICDSVRVMTGNRHIRSLRDRASVTEARGALEEALKELLAAEANWNRGNE